MHPFQKYNALCLFVLTGILFAECKKSNEPVTPPYEPALTISSIKIDNAELAAGSAKMNVSTSPHIKITFNNPVDRATVSSSVTIKQNATAVVLNISYENKDSVLIVQPQSALTGLTKYSLALSTLLKAVNAKNLSSAAERIFVTAIDSSAKFAVISDSALLDKVQLQTFKYFWDFGHPVSGLARERNNGDNETVTSGGSGFGIMAIPVAVTRNFITRAEGLGRLQKIVAFLKNNAVKVKGAFPHWLNGTTGAIIPFSANDDGADLVETSYLMVGLLTARQIFNGSGTDETALRNDINDLWSAVEWDWFRNGGQNVLYWHYSNNKQWAMNFPIKGWNECLVTYILAASSASHGVPAAVYTSGWAGGSGFFNGNNYYNYKLPLGPELGGPLFFSHYSFLGINPNGLEDQYANYQSQTTNHTLINFNYCRANPSNQFGYSADCWGLTASDIPNGYDASSPTKDLGVIAPTAALSSFPYTPEESMKALKFFYYVLGDKIWKEYGFVDAFSLKEAWFANSHLAIDQGPIIVMIENYRTGLIWNLLTSCPEVKNGMKTLGFTAPYLN